jgi:hypothetical protein
MQVNYVALDMAEVKGPIYLAQCAASGCLPGYALDAAWAAFFFSKNN